MQFIPTPLAGCYIVEPELLHDQRGYFMQSFHQDIFEKGVGQKVRFVQDNQSFSAKGVLRGLHYQTGARAQAKLVRVIQGEILDVAVDIRPGSATYGQHIEVVLSEANHKQLFIPRGFAHGFLVLSDTATFFYKCDNFYDRQSEGGIIYNDPELDIDWCLAPEALIISEKDQSLPDFKNARKVW